MKNSKKLKTLPALALLLWASLQITAQVKAVTIDFSSAPPGPTFLPFSENGFTFTQLGGGFDWKVNGIAQYLSGGASATVRLTRTDNGLFDLSSLDVTFRGSLDALGTFGLSTSGGGTRDLSAVGHYTFAGAGFEGLNWVDMTIVMSGSFGDNTFVDNIVVNNTASVPDAGSTAALLGCSLVGLATLRRRFGV